jgi:hypothetical protein
MDEDFARVLYKDEEWPIAGCDCPACGNFFFYVDLPEFAPKLCCYCGLRFRGYVDWRGVDRHLNGLPKE